MKIELIRKGNDYLIRRRLFGFIPLWWTPFSYLGNTRTNCFTGFQGSWRFSCDLFCRFDRVPALRHFRELELEAAIYRRSKELDKEFQKAKGEVVEVIEA